MKQATDRAVEFEEILHDVVRALSPHYTHPWRFRVANNVLELYANHARALPASDPQHRELIISCGAVLLNARVALRHLGCEAEINLLPDPLDPTLVACIRPGDDSPPSNHEEALFTALCAEPSSAVWSDPRLSLHQEVRTVLATTVHEGAWCVRVPEENRQLVVDLLVRADRIRYKSRAYREEEAESIRATHALGSGLLSLAVRNLDVGQWRARHDSRLASLAPVLAVLGTRRDDPLAWLHTGQAMQRMALECRVRGLHMVAWSQVAQIEELREPLARAVLHTHAWPQLLFGIGRARPRRRPTPFPERWS